MSASNVPEDKPSGVQLAPTLEERIKLYKSKMHGGLDFTKGLFILRQWDGMDGCWCDCTPAAGVTAGVVLTAWCERTNEGTERTSFSDIDYYRIFEADTRMKWDGGAGREMFRDE